MPTPSSSLLSSSFYSHKLHPHTPSISKPLPFPSRRRRSRSTSPPSSSSSSYSTYNAPSFRKPPRIEIATAALAKRSAKDDDDDYLLDHKISAFKSLERLNRPTANYRSSGDLGSEYLSSSRTDYSSGSASGSPRYNSSRSSLGDSWDTGSALKSSRYATSPTPSMAKPSTITAASGSKECPRSRESSPVSNGKPTLSRKIAEFLHRTDHAGDVNVGAKKAKPSASRLSTLSGDDLKPSSRSTSRLSDQEERPSSRLSTLGDEIPRSRLNNDREVRSLSRVSQLGEIKPKYHLDVDDTPKPRETRSVSRISRAGSETNTAAESNVTSKARSSLSSDRDKDVASHSSSHQKHSNRLGEITEDYADEHSTASLATERLNIECSERSRLEKELAEAQTTNKKLQDTSDKLEAEVQCLRATDALSLDEGSEEDGGVFKKKYERAMRELELTKHRLTTQHQDDLEQLVALRKQLESKLSDAYEQIEEQRSVTSEWKRKVARINSEMSDLRLALEEQSSRNNLLEKKQRKFDAEFSMLQDELRQERNLKEKAMRDKELALGDKYTVEQTMSSLKLELELKEQKLSSLQQELEELTFSGNTEEEVANLKKKKHALEAKITDQEEELDELAGQVQMLEQAKLKVEMSLEQLRKAHRKELASKDEELESLRCSTQKKVKALQCQLDSEHESRTQLLRERHELERRLNTLEDMGVASQAADAETNQRLKRDLKRTKALLKDTQSMLAQARQDNPNKLLLRQLRNQLEDAELGRSAATKAKLGLEGDLADLATSLDETQRARQEAETRLSEVQRERGSLQSMLDETEEEMTEVLKKYQASVAQLSTEQSNLQEATTRISELESENAAYKSQLSDLNARLETIETHGDPSSTLALKRLQLKSKELESKLEFEHTTRSRLEVQISRLKETTDKLQSECNILRSKESSSSNDSRKLQRQIRELKETIQALEAKGINESMKRKELEKEVQCREAEISSLKNELSVASQRIQDLQHAIQGDLDDDDDSDSDASSDQDQDPSSDEEYNSQLDDDGYDSKDTLRSSSDVGR